MLSTQALDDLQQQITRKFGQVGDMRAQILNRTIEIAGDYIGKDELIEGVSLDTLCDTAIDLAMPMERLAELKGLEATISHYAETEHRGIALKLQRELISLKMLHILACAGMIPCLKHAASRYGIDPAPLVRFDWDLNQANLADMVACVESISAATKCDVDEKHDQPAQPPTHDFRNARWFTRNSNGALYADLLRMAVHRGTLKRSKNPRGSWQHSVDEVANCYPEHSDGILRALQRESSGDKM